MLIGRTHKLCVVVVAGALLCACAPTTFKLGLQSVEPVIIDNKLIVADGTQLPVRKWTPKKTRVKAILLVAHGFNDYSIYFKPPGEYLA